jgi:hypothetical protein
VGTDLLVFAQELLISEDTPVAVSAHDLCVSESTSVPSLARLLEISVFQAACVLLRNVWCQWQDRHFQVCYLTTLSVAYSRYIEL